MSDPHQPGTVLPLDLAFKGARTYVQSADMLDGLLAVVGVPPRLSLNCHRLTGQALNGVVLAENEAVPADAVGIFDSPGLRVALMEAVDRSVTRRVPYDEPAVIIRAIHDGKAIHQPISPDFSFFEQVVACHKSLLQRLFPDPHIKWLFTKISLAGDWRTGQQLNIENISALGTKLVKSRISVDGQPCGFIFFSAVYPS